MNPKAAKELEALYEQEYAHLKPPEDHRIKYRYFRPKLNPTQDLAYDEVARFILLHGERATGKTIVALHKLVEHCRNSRNARALIITGVRRQAEEGGAWHKLLVDVLPQWKQGCGLEYTEPRLTVSKDTYIWIANRFGGWSRVVLLSMPVAGFVEDRVKGMEPTFVLVDEAQALESVTYFTDLAQQVGRVKGGGLQQLVYCCNPAGPSHWLYGVFFLDCYIEHEDGTKTRDLDYAVYHVPIQENLHNLEPGYWEKNVIGVTKGDDIKYRRLVLGEWIDAPDGEALFKEDFIELKHVIGKYAEGTGLWPNPLFPIQLGYDLGMAHSCITFEQFTASTQKLCWMVFDEINAVDRHVPYRILVPQILKRLDYWEAQTKTKFRCEHISDNSAFNQFRAATGSFDAQDVEAISGGRIRMIECPKGPGSVETRVRQTKEKLEETELLVSAMCPKTIEMFRQLPRDKENYMMPQKKSRFLHPFDSLTYPQLFYGSTRKNTPGRHHVGPVESQVYAMGSA